MSKKSHGWQMPKSVSTKVGTFVHAKLDQAAEKIAETTASKNPAGMVKQMATMAGMMPYHQSYKLFLDGITGDMKKAKKHGKKTAAELEYEAIGKYPGFYELLETYKIDRTFISGLAEGILEKD